MNLLQNLHLVVIECLYRGRHAVFLQTFFTGHSNRKLTIVMALSTTFTQYASEITKFGKIRQNKGHFALLLLLLLLQNLHSAQIQACSSRRRILVPIESPYTTSY